jgi:hypothetical protein
MECPLHEDWLPTYRKTVTICGGYLTWGSGPSSSFYFLICVGYPGTHMPDGLLAAIKQLLWLAGETDI